MENVGDDDDDSIDIVQQFFAARNEKNFDEIMDFFTDDCIYEDTAYSKPFHTKQEVKQYLIQSINTLPFNNAHIVLLDAASSSSSKSLKEGGTKVAATWHIINSHTGEVVPGTRHNSIYTIIKTKTTTLHEKRKISSVFEVTEPLVKQGSVGVAILSAASKIIEILGKYNPKDQTTTKTNQDPFLLSDSLSTVERFYQGWNRREIDAVIACFAKDCVYDDMQFPNRIIGQENVKHHFNQFSDSVPKTFSFVIDDLILSKDGRKAGVRWHVENNGEQLMFTRGCSFYTMNESGQIQMATDIPEPAIVRPGDIGYNALLSIANQISNEPQRIIPLILWLAYMYIVFFSDGILPGANALALEQRTWMEVRDLSLNFFLIAPLLHLPLSPTVHPMLEGIFNLLLAWAAMFAGFLSDDRRNHGNKPNIFPMPVAIVGMQFLTSAFLLPYLVTRMSEPSNIQGKKDSSSSTTTIVTQEELDPISRIVGEFRGLGIILGTVGITSIVWALMGRYNEFGSISERWISFLDLLSIDRVGCSFIVDLILFGLFQGWLIDDDLRRRHGLMNDNDDDSSWMLGQVAKYIPFFGLVIYLTFRPSIPSLGNDE